MSAYFPSPGLVGVNVTPLNSTPGSFASRIRCSTATVSSQGAPTCSKAFDDGTGSQAAAVWERGGLKIAYGFGLLDPRLRSRTPVNLALEQLGVVADDRDEFDTVRLGRHARTADWPVSPDA